MARICIDVTPEGLSVGLEPAKEEAMEGEAPEGMGMEGAEMGAEMSAESDKSYMEPVADERELMMKVRDLIAQAQNPEANAEAEAGFENGFKKAGGVVDMKGLMG